MKSKKNEEGFVLIVSLVIMVIVSIIGIAALTNTSLELQVAGNDRVHKETFYKAEAGDILAAEILEQNIYCATGFSVSRNSSYDVYTYNTEGVGDPGNLHSRSVDERDFGADIAGSAVVRTFGWLTDTAITNTSKIHDYKDLAFYLNDRPWEGTTCEIFMPDRPTISFPISNISTEIDSDTERTDVYLGGSVRKLAGGALQMAAGYERLGKSAAGGGTVRNYDLISRHRGLNSSESIVVFGWDHLVGTEYGDDANCK